jgi:Ca2+-binding RTX toxin-like protein
MKRNGEEISMITWTYHQGFPDSVFGDFHLAVLGSIYGPATTTELPLVGPPRELVFTGDFDVIGGEVTGGTVTGFKLYKAGVLVLSATGYAIDVLALVDAVAGFNSDDKATLQSLLYARPMTIYGSAENDIPMQGGKAADVIHGGAGDDLIYDGGETDNVADALYGEEGNDALVAYLGDDLLDGGGGADIMEGGGGNDVYVVGDIGDKVVEAAGEGIDTVRSSIDFTLPEHVERLVLTGTAKMDGAGNALANAITGNKARNVLKGGEGNDVIIGKGGKDTISGGLGVDLLTGNGGKDRFLFGTALGADNIDRIKGFKPGKDKVLLDDAVFAGLDAGKLKASAFFAGKSADDGNARIGYDEKRGGLSYDGDGKGGADGVLFAKVKKGLDIDQGDFLVV